MRKDIFSGWFIWLVSVTGWLVCAAMCLVLVILLESFPYGYDLFFPAVLLILFCNIFIFLFITSRWGLQLKRLVRAVFRVILGEGLILAGMYGLARFAM